MLIPKDRGLIHPLSSEITPRGVYERRREFLRLMAAGAAGAGLAAWAGRAAMGEAARPGKLAPLAGVKSAVPGATVPDKLTPYQDVTTYNNFYEFGDDKSDPAEYAGALRTRPWSVSIEGE